MTTLALSDFVFFPCYKCHNVIILPWFIVLFAMFTAAYTSNFAFDCNNDTFLSTHLKKPEYHNRDKKKPYSKKSKKNYLKIMKSIKIEFFLIYIKSNF